MKPQKLIYFIFVLTSIFISVFLSGNSNADPLDHWHWRNPLPQVGYVSKMTYANGMYVAVGGAISSSPDGVNWTVRVSDTSDSVIDNCVVTLSSDLRLHVPIVNFHGLSYWADFQVIPDSLEIQLTDYGLLTDAGPFSDCQPSSLSPDLILHIPTILFNGVSYLADFTHNYGSFFTLSGVGQKTDNTTAYQLSPESTYQEGCVSPCLCPITIGRKISGTFKLIQLNPSPLFNRFSLDEISWNVIDSDGNVVHTITGFGMYQRGGEFAQAHQLVLELSIDNNEQTRLDSGLVPDESQFPVISISVDLGTQCYDIMMDINARPGD